MKSTSVFLFAISFVLAAVYADEYHSHRDVRSRTTTRAASPEEKTQDFWLNMAQDDLARRLLIQQKRTKAKNVIFFIGDGMSVTTLAASRTFEGQRRGEPGEENNLSFEKFPVVGLSHTYCVDVQVADSACSATAYLGGVKANDATAGVSAAVLKGDCAAMRNVSNHVKSIAHHALEAGKSAGIVTTTRVTHASPSGAYAHIANRDWECDADVSRAGQDPSVCRDIAYQLVHDMPGKDFQVILGGGRQKFLPRVASSEGQRLDGEDLTTSWKLDKDLRGAKSSYVTTRQQLLDVKNQSDYLLGLFNPSHVDYNLLSNKELQPSLEEMTEAAIKILEKNSQGFFLFVEGGRIDHAHHDTYVQMALDETIEMSKAVQKARDLTNQDETLIVVTSDHAHVMTLAGYPSRGNDILGVNDLENGSDGLPYLTLSYANGPGYRPDVTYKKRPDVTQESGYINRDPRFQAPTMVPLSSETHGGEDVAVFASGPWEHLFTGSYQQHFIPHMMAYALCVGPGATACPRHNFNIVAVPEN